MEEREIMMGAILSTNIAGTRNVNPKQRARNCGVEGKCRAGEERRRVAEDMDGGNNGGVSLGKGATAGGITSSKVEGRGKAED